MKEDRPICNKCEIKPVESRGRKNGRQVLGKTCYSCRRPGYLEKLGGRNVLWPKYKKEKCEQCGFIPKHKCQLDVDHIDGNKKNNDPINYQTLCANCHRLKTYLCREGIYQWNIFA